MTADVDMSLIGSVIGGAITVATAFVFVGRKIERVDARLGRIEEELAVHRSARLEQRVIVLEQQISDVKSRITTRPEVN